MSNETKHVEEIWFPGCMWGVLFLQCQRLTLLSKWSKL